MSCIFCDIVDKKVSAMIVGENEGAVAFLDVNPISDGHTIVIPKNHVKHLSQASNKDLESVMSLVKEVANKLLNSKLRP
jgi:histidine triad (HIT) family protein